MVICLFRTWCYGDPLVSYTLYGDSLVSYVVLW